MRRNKLRQMAQKGQHGDTVLGHLTPDEIIVHPQYQTPAVMNQLRRAIPDLGRYTVGGSDDRINPRTGAPAYYGGTGGNPGGPGAGQGAGGDASSGGSTGQGGTGGHPGGPGAGQGGNIADVGPGGNLSGGRPGGVGHPGVPQGFGGIPSNPDQGEFSGHVGFPSRRPTQPPQQVPNINMPVNPTLSQKNQINKNRQQRNAVMGAFLGSMPGLPGMLSSRNFGKTNPDQASIGSMVGDIFGGPGAPNAPSPGPGDTSTGEVADSSSPVEGRMNRLVAPPPPPRVESADLISRILSRRING